MPSISRYVMHVYRLCTCQAFLAKLDAQILLPQSAMQLKMIYLPRNCIIISNYITTHQMLLQTELDGVSGQFSRAM